MMGRGHPAWVTTDRRSPATARRPCQGAHPIWGSAASEPAFGDLARPAGGPAQPRRRQSGLSARARHRDRSVLLPARRVARSPHRARLVASAPHSLYHGGRDSTLLKSSAMAANRRISSGASGCLRGRGGRAPASCSRLSRGSGRRLQAALLVAPLVDLHVDPGDPAAQPSVLLPGGYRASAGVALVRLLSAHRLAAVVLDEPLERIRDEPGAVVLMQVAVGFGAHPSPRYGNRRYPCCGAGYWRAIDRPRITEPPRGSRKGAR